uniref:Uncharacterized protein n=1 Tax=Marmota marmota marmota TaxID=9994 RepID=A0A8C5Z5P0_MARMA
LTGITSSCFMFKCWKNCQTVFQNNYTILHSYQQCIKVLISPYLSVCMHVQLSQHHLLNRLFFPERIVLVFFICLRFQLLPPYGL